MGDSEYLRRKQDEEARREEEVPTRFPEASELGRGSDRYAEVLAEIEEYSDDEQRAILWTIALENAFEEQNIARDIRGLETVTYGFADPETEADAFGVLIYTVPTTPELDDFEREELQVSPVEISGERFPVFVRPSQIEFHFSGVHPELGTAACWATSRKTEIKNKTGFLTAKHVVGSPRVLGNSIRLTKGMGKLLDLAPEGIDAALVKVSKRDMPESLRRFSTEKYVAQWTDVQVYGRFSGPFETKFTEVTSSRGSLNYNIPLRIFLADFGKPGDSGSLVLNSRGEGVGIYMGAVKTLANGVDEGLCQHLGQVAESMSLDLALDETFGQ